MEVLLFLFVVCIKLAQSQDSPKFNIGAELIHKNAAKFLKIINYVDHSDPIQIRDILDGKAETEYTIFFPLNKAFDVLSSQEMEAMMDDLELRKKMALAHIFKGVHTRDQLPGQTLTSLNGAEITFTDGDQFQAPDGSSIRVVEGEVSARKGIIYPIEGIIHLIETETATNAI